MSIALVTNAIGKLADANAKMVLLQRNHAILARQTQRTAEFQKRFPNAIRFDWLEYAKLIRTLETKLSDAMEFEARLREKVRAWTDRNLISDAAKAVRIDLESIGVTNIAGMSTAGLGIPLEPVLRLGDGTFTNLASDFLTLNRKASDALALVRDIEKTHMDTLQRAREALRQHGLLDAVRDLDGVIAQNAADATQIGRDPSVVILVLLGLWAVWKVWGWYRGRKGSSRG